MRLNARQRVLLREAYYHLLSKDTGKYYRFHGGYAQYGDTKHPIGLTLYEKSWVLPRLKELMDDLNKAYPEEAKVIEAGDWREARELEDKEMQGKREVEI